MKLIIVYQQNLLQAHFPARRVTAGPLYGHIVTTPDTPVYRNILWQENLPVSHKSNS